MLQEFCLAASMEPTCSLGEAVRRGGTDRAGAAHNHVFDGPRRFPEVACRNYLEFVRQKPLLDQQNRIAPGVKCYSPEMTGAALERDVQTIATLSFRMVLSMLR